MIMVGLLPASSASATSPCNGPNPPDWCTPGGPGPTCTGHNLTAPTIAGDLRVGKTATADKGTWNNANQFSYQWQRDGSDISGAVAQTYPIAVADSGHHLTVEVTGWSTLCDESTAASSQTGAVGLGDAPTGTGAELQGAARVGHVMTVVKGTWTAPCSTPTYGYQWFRDASEIPGANGTTRTLTTDDWGYNMSVKVTGTCPGYQQGVAWTYVSSLTNVLAGDPLATVVAPTASGTVAMSHTLTVDHGTWSPAAVSYDYLWYRDGKRVDVPLGTNTYKIGAADVGTNLLLVVKAYSAGRVSGIPYYQPGTSYVPLGKVAPGAKPVYKSSKLPKITGTFKSGHRLSLSRSAATLMRSFSPDATSLRYRWYRDSKKISHATNSTYKLTKSDRKKKIRVRIYAVRAGYTTGWYDTKTITVKK